MDLLFIIIFFYVRKNVPRGTVEAATAPGSAFLPLFPSREGVRFYIISLLSPYVHSHVDALSSRYVITKQYPLRAKIRRFPPLL